MEADQDRTVGVTANIVTGDLSDTSQKLYSWMQRITARSSS